MELRRVLPADVYDALELSALAHGGIGAGEFFEGDHEDGAPCCILGHIRFLNDRDVAIATRCLQDADGSVIMPNDRAVAKINKRRGEDKCARVPFADFCAELGIVRGDA